MPIKIFNDTPKDSLLVLVTVLAVIYPFAFAYQFGLLSWTSILFWSIGMIITAVWHFNTTMHYHLHRRVFTNDKANNWLDALSGIPMQIGLEEYKPIHMNHHKWANDPIVDGKIHDPTSTYRYGKNGAEESIWSYCIIGPIRHYKNIMGPDCANDIIWKHPEKMLKEDRVKKLSFFLLLLINFKFIPLYVIIVYMARSISLIITYLEHHNISDWTDPKKDSQSQYNWLYNLLTFNSGYHQEHHYRPGAHWTQMKEIKKLL